MSDCLSKKRICKKTLKIFTVFLFLSCASISFAEEVQPPPMHVDLSSFPATAVDDVVVPVPSEVFGILDKLGTPNWNAEISKSFGKNTGNRAQVALLLGTVIADGFIAVQAHDSEKIKDIGREILVLAEAVGIKDAVVARSKSIMDKANSKNWPAVRIEFDGALQDVRTAMDELNDGDLAQLVSLGGWLRGTQVLTSIVSKDYSRQAAELLHQPELINFFIRRIDEMNSRLARENIVLQVKKTLQRIRPLIGRNDGSNISEKNIGRILTLTTDAINSIRGEEE
ncbi:MAG: hypothetical protein ACK5NG_07525 [Chthoniobacterales bacterium]